MFKPLHFEMATLVKLVPLILVLLVINACRAEDLDAKLNANKDKLTNAINNKCKTKGLSLPKMNID